MSIWQTEQGCEAKFKYVLIWPHGTVGMGHNITMSWSTIKIHCTLWLKKFAAVVTHSPPTSEVSGSNFGPYVGKLVVAYWWSAVYSTEPLPTVCTRFLCPQNYPSWYDQYSVDCDLNPQTNKLWLKNQSLPHRTEILTHKVIAMIT